MTQAASSLLQAARAWLSAEAAALPASLQAAIDALYLAVEAGHVCIRVDSANTSDWLQSGWVGAPGSYTPFILENTGDAARLYLARYHQYEAAIAADLRQRAAQVLQPVALTALRRDVDALFGSAADDQQRRAALLAQFRALTLVSGGPGTGKTTTVVKLLALLQAQALLAPSPPAPLPPGERGVSPLAPEERPSYAAPHQPGEGDVSPGLSRPQESPPPLYEHNSKATPDLSAAAASAEHVLPLPSWERAGERGALQILLAAPTGKAAQRLSESIRHAKQKLALPEAVLDAIPESAQTLHRLLGAQGDSGRFRHDAGHPLRCDVLLIDEASMIDLGLMQAVLAALPAQARLILLGDRDQLASVEAGSVFGDLCAGSGMSAALAAQLQGVGVAATAAAGSSVLADCRVELTRSYRFDAGSGIALLAQAARAGDAAAFVQTLAGAADVEAVARKDLRAQLQAGYAAFQSAAAGGDVAAAFAAFSQFRVLCAHRQGAAGIAGLNAVMEAGRASWYAGRPVIVRANDYALRLFNGDIGICLPTAEGLRVFFESTGGGFRALAPGRLPAHESAWAMTVHQAQGSEFDAVLLVLPEQVSAVLDRPLVYTAVTRAKARFALCAETAVLTAALATLPARESGLVEKLRS